MSQEDEFLVFEVCEVLLIHRLQKDDFSRALDLHRKAWFSLCWEPVKVLVANTRTNLYN